MASKRESQPDQEAEGEIPVFTVLKNGAILKNIFMVNKPPEPAPSSISNPKTVASFHDHEDILIVGRHPDCNIMVTHPSISRFHLQIHSKPSSHKLSVIDLSSVHGTWVSDRKLEPGVSVELKEGDTLRIGGSSRVYRLHWIPISGAYDLENPFISELDVVMAAEKAQEDAAVEEEKVESVQNLQNGDFSALDDEEMQSADSVMECIGSLFLNENLEVTEEKDFSSATSLPEDVIFSFDEGKSSAKDNDHPETFELSCEIENDLFDIENLAISPLHVEPTLQCDNLRSSLKIPEKMSGILVDPKSQSHAEEEHEAYPEAEKPQNTEVSSTVIEYLTESSSLPLVEAVQETNMRRVDEIQGPPDSLTSLLLPSEQEIFFEYHMSNLLKNVDHIFFDETSAAVEVEVPARNEFGYTLGKTDKVKDISTLEARNLMTECICLPVEKANFDSRELTLQCHNPESSLKIPEKMSGILVDLKSQSHVEEEHEPYPEAEKPQKTEVSSTLIEYLTESSSLPVVAAVQGTNMPQANESQGPPDSLTSLLLPSEQETFFKNHKSNLLKNMDHAFFDQANVAAEVEVPPGHEFGYTFEKTDKVKDISTLEAKNPVTECICLPVEEANFDARFQQVPFFEEQAAPDSLSDGGERDKDCEELKLKMPVPLNTKASHEEGLSMVEYFQENDDCWCLDSLFPISFLVESVNSSMPEEAVLEIAGKESQTTQSLVAGCSEKKTCVEAMEKNSTFGNIWSRRGKAASAPQIRTSKSKIKSTAGADIKVDISNEKDLLNKSISKDLSSVLDGEDEEIFTPDKENFSPNTLKMRFLKDKGKLEVFTPDKENFSLQMQVLKINESLRSHNSKANCAPSVYPDESLSPTSNKENQTPKATLEKSARRPFGSRIKLEQKQGTMALKNRVQRVPFESLLMNSGGKSRSEISGHVSAVKSVTADDCGQILDKHTNPSHISRERKKNWDMIVDTASLLDRESRKALQLLQGLKGTRLIIPRMVTKELDSMKHQFSIFRRRSEASLALEWLEECMMKTKWWIHVQSTLEEGMLIAPTPPASPQTQFSEDSWTFPYSDGILQPLSSCKSSVEIVSPTADDHILDFALLHRRKQKDGQLVLLSDDVTLKIKSMAEGLLCETVQEFRESLVNPFSERFLWTNSSPRGLTWSCQDDVVLREKFSRFPSKKSVKGEGARGLKLILLHNSHYGHTSSAR